MNDVPYENAVLLMCAALLFGFMAGGAVMRALTIKESKS